MASVSYSMKMNEDRIPSSESVETFAHCVAWQLHVTTDAHDYVISNYLPILAVELFGERSKHRNDRSQVF